MTHIDELVLSGHGIENQNALGDLKFAQLKALPGADGLTAGELSQLWGQSLTHDSKICLRFCHSAESPLISEFAFSLTPGITVYGIPGVAFGYSDYGSIYYPLTMKEFSPKQ